MSRSPPPAVPLWIAAISTWVAALISLTGKWGRGLGFTTTRGWIAGGEQAAERISNTNDTTVVPEQRAALSSILIIRQLQLYSSSSVKDSWVLSMINLPQGSSSLSMTLILEHRALEPNTSMAIEMCEDRGPSKIHTNMFLKRIPIILTVKYITWLTCRTAIRTSSDTYCTSVFPLNQVPPSAVSRYQDFFPLIFRNVWAFRDRLLTVDAAASAPYFFSKV